MADPNDPKWRAKIIGEARAKADMVPLSDFEAVLAALDAAPSSTALEVCEQKNAAAKTVMDGLMRQHDDTTRELEETRRQHAAEATDLEIRHEKEKMELRMELEDKYKTALEEAKEQVAKLQARVDSEADSARLTIDQLEKKLEEEETAVVTLEKILETTIEKARKNDDRHLITREDMLYDLRERHSLEMKDLKKDHAEKMEAMKLNLNTALHNSLNMEAAVEETGEALVRSSKNLADVYEQIDYFDQEEKKAREALRLAREEADDLRRRLDEAEEKLRRKQPAASPRDKEALDKLDKELRECMAERDRLKAALDDEKSKAPAAPIDAKELDKIKRELDAARAECQRLQNALDDCEKKKAPAPPVDTKEVEKLKRELDAARAECQRLQNALDDCEKKKAPAPPIDAKEVERIRDELADYRARCNRLQVALDQCEKQRKSVGATGATPQPPKLTEFLRVHHDQAPEEGDAAPGAQPIFVTPEPIRRSVRILFYVLDAVALFVLAVLVDVGAERSARLAAGMSYYRNGGYQDLADVLSFHTWDDVILYGLLQFYFGCRFIVKFDPNWIVAFGRRRPAAPPPAAEGGE